MADRKGSALRRRLASAERFSEAAIARGERCVKTPDLRSSALLSRVTLADQRRLVVVARRCVLVVRRRGLPLGRIVKARAPATSLVWPRHSFAHHRPPCPQSADYHCTGCRHTEQSPVSCPSSVGLDEVPRLFLHLRRALCHGRLGAVERRFGPVSQLLKLGSRNRFEAHNEVFHRGNEDTRLVVRNPQRCLRRASRPMVRMAMPSSSYASEHTDSFRVSEGQCAERSQRSVGPMRQEWSVPTYAA